MPDRGLFVTLQAIRRQLGAMPCELYLVRLIHHASRRAFPGERLWTATQLTQASVVRFLRIRNREGCDCLKKGRRPSAVHSPGLKSPQSRHS